MKTIYTDGKKMFVFNGKTLSDEKGVILQVVNRVVREAKSKLGLNLVYVGR